MALSRGKPTTVTSEFRHEWERELEEKLRRRFKWYSLTVVVLNTVGALMGAAMIVLAGLMPSAGEGASIGEAELAANAVNLRVTGVNVVVNSLVTVFVFAVALAHVSRRPLERSRLVDLVTWLILGVGVFGFVTHGATQLVVAEIDARAFLIAGGGSDFATFGIQGAFSIGLIHAIASLFLPWTAKESLRPVWPLFYAYVVVALVLSWDRPVFLLGTVVATAVFAVPGTVIAWWKHSRFRDRFHQRALRKRYGDLKRDLFDARRLHEDLFPPVIDEGPLLLRYTYQPMRQIGGDYLYARLRRDEDGEIVGAHVIVLDVTGHGIPAALTVNRLHGEIDRQLALDSDASPGDLLAAINEYLHLTVAQRSMYATALCIEADLRGGVVRWASAGHPPAFLRAVDGRLFHLFPTTIVLGAVPPGEFDRVTESMAFGAGDVVFAYTDGAIETRNESNAMLSVRGLEGMLVSLPFDRGAPHELDATSEIADRLEAVRRGPAEDDTLLVQLSRPVGFEAGDGGERVGDEARGVGEGARAR